MKTKKSAVLFIVVGIELDEAFRFIKMVDCTVANFN